MSPPNNLINGVAGRTDLAPRRPRAWWRLFRFLLANRPVDPVGSCARAVPPLAVLGIVAGALVRRSSPSRVAGSIASIPFRSSPRDNTYILLFTDRFSRRADVFPVTAAEFTAEGTNNILVNQYFP